MRLRPAALLLWIAALHTPAAAAELPYAESFNGPDGSPWPAPWTQGSAHVTLHDLQGGRARLNGDPQWVCRMLLTGYAETDIEAQMTFEFANVAGQGIGFYARQNGGTLREYLPHGQGYAMFLKGSWAWPEDLGLWYEVDGVEVQFHNAYNPVAGGLQNGVRYRLRYRVTQQDPATTLLQARVWPEGDAEPAVWTIEGTNAQPLLQNTPGGFAVDIYNHFGTSPIFVDDLSIERFPPPVAVGAPAPPRTLALSAPRPNPSRGEARAELTLAQGGEVELVLLDLAGRAAHRVAARDLAAGVHSLRVPTAGLAPGVYQLVARGGGSLAARRLVVSR